MPRAPARDAGAPDGALAAAKFTFWLGRRVSLGSVALRQREWNHAHSHKQKQIKSAPNKVRFDGGINLFFHLVLSLLESCFPQPQTYIMGAGRPFYSGTPDNVNTFFLTFFKPRIQATPRLRRDRCPRIDTNDPNAAPKVRANSYS